MLSAPVLAFLSIGCSSAPKVPDERFETRDKAADYVKLADSLVGQGQFDSAAKYYRQAMDTNSSVDWLPGTAMAHHSLGRLYLLEGDLEGAEGEFKQATQYATLAGNEKGAAMAASLAATGLGEVAFRRGDHQAALARFEEAVRSAGSDEKPLAIALHDRASAKFALGEAAGATADLDRASAINLKLKRWSELASNHFLRSSFLEKGGDLAKAMAEVQEALVNDRKAENSYGVVGDLAKIADLSSRLGKAEDAYWYWRRSFDAALGANLARESLRAIDGIIGSAEAAGKTDEIDGWKAKRAKLATAMGPTK